MRFKIIIFLFILPVLVWAKGEGGIPARFVFFQVFNFSLFALALFYLTRKKLPVFLKQKQQDFLDYRTRAKELEKQNQTDCLFLEKEVQTLIKKKQDIKKSVAKALKALQEDLEIQERQWLENLNTQAAQEIKRQRLKELSGLKNRVLSKVMRQTKKQLKEMEEEELLRKLNHKVIQKWEQI